MDQSLKLNDKPIKAGFPNAADESAYNNLNLHKLLIKRPASTYFMRLEGSLHTQGSNYTQTLLVVDRSAEMQSGDSVVAIIRGEMLVKQYKHVKNRHWLISPTYGEKSFELIEGVTEVQIWGVITYSIESSRGFGGEF